MSYTIVGKPLGRLEGPAKVTGAATFTADVILPRMVWGKVREGGFGTPFYEGDSPPPT